MGLLGERRGAGWGQQHIPERMTRCFRSDRSQPWLMKPKHFHRCFYTLGSTSSPRPSSTPTLCLSTQPVSLQRASTCSNCGAQTPTVWTVCLLQRQSCSEHGAEDDKACTEDILFFKDRVKSLFTHIKPITQDLV